MDAKEMTSPVPATNGFGGAALLAAGIGAFTLAVLAVATDKIAPLQRAMIYYRPTGPLSGVTTSGIVVWLVAWFVLNRRWRNRTVALRTVGAAALALLVLSLLLTFPPLADVL